MRKNAAHSLSISWIIRRALEGNISPLSYLIILGFFSSIVLLYVSLRVHFSNISGEISTSHTRLERVMNTNAQLLARYNDLTSYERIIPIAKEMGLRACSQEDVKRLTLYEKEQFDEKEAAGWEQAEGPVSRKGGPEIDLKGR